MSQTFYAAALGVSGIVLFGSFLIRVRAGREISKYGEKEASSGVSGEELAERVKNEEGMRELEVTGSGAGGSYNPGEDRVEVPELDDDSLLGLGLMAHELAHARQVRSSPFIARLITILEYGGLVASLVGPPMLVIGLLFYPGMALAGLALYLAVIPVIIIEMGWEWRASSIALGLLERHGEVGEGDRHGLKKLLWLAILTRLSQLSAGLFRLIDFEEER